MKGNLEFAFKCVLMSSVTCTGTVCPQLACVCPMLLWVEMCVVIGPVFAIRFKMPTIQVKTREGNEQTKQICQEIWLLLLFSSEIKRKMRVRRQRGRMCVCGGWSWERQRQFCSIAHRSLINLCLGCWKLLLGHACKGCETEAEQDLGEGREESKDVEGGGEDVEKPKQLQGRGGFSLIRREHGGELEQHTHPHACTHPLLHTLTPQWKVITPIVSCSGSQVMNWGAQGPALLSRSPSAQVHHVWNNEADLMKFSLAAAATLIWRWAH